jgi:peptidoglycan-N-acetylglucosamine deacetylase
MKLRATLVAVAVLALLASAQAPTTAAPSAPQAAGLVALTFDDGPSPQLTPRVLDVLKKNKVKATFFLQGSEVVKYPGLVRRISNEGHVIGNHGWSHPDFTTISAEQADREITRTNDAIEAVTGTEPVLFRYPFGKESEAGNAVIRREGMWGGILWHWTAPLPGDFECPGARGVQRYIERNSVDQALILLHDAGDTIGCGVRQLDYLQQTITSLKQKGYRFGVAELAWGPSPVNQYSWVKVVPR